MTTAAPAGLWPEVQPDAARRLMLSGLRSFAERGFHATTTRDIATGAGMSPAALYVYFPSKVGLLFAISRSGHEQTLAMVSAAIAKGTDPVSSMRHVVAEFVAWHAERHTVARVVQYELAALPAQEYAVVADLRRQTERLVRDVISAGVTEGVFDVPDVRVAARAVLSLGVDVARWYTERSRTTPAELGAQYSGLILRMLGATTENR
ncbi:MAG TPA: TetR/AcrR family transcriptional regulator [Pseudonocardiaceae bacterium]|jgi:AcrR family transcriptional regulator|nr:TetR/AcrR family transcriptional regulator [Pseudonocardiaceae bacterium]